MIEFVHPGFLYALPAVLVPVVIHLLSRRRYRHVQWAAMDHLVRAERRVRRRLRWENVLLLALRCAAVALLVLLFAQPVLSRALPGMAAGKHAVFMLLDDSASTAQVTDGSSAFDRAKAFVLAAAEKLSDRGTDVTAFVASEEKAFFEAAPLRSDDLSRLRDELGRRRPSAVAFHPASRLPALGRAAPGDGRSLSFYVLTDLRAADWGAAGLDAAVRPALEGLQARGLVLILDFGTEPGPNAGLVDVLGADRPAYAQTASTLQAVVQNDAPTPLAAGAVSIRLDGLPLPPVPSPGVPAGEARDVPLDVFFGRATDHPLELSLPAGDTFPPDDRRFASLRAVERLSALVVAGEEGAGAAGSPAFYLRAALQPGRGAAGVQADVEAASGAPPPDLAGFGAVFVADVASPLVWQEALVRYVKAGGRLVVFLGGNADRDAWSAALLGEAGLLPCALEGRAEAPTGAAFHLGQLDFSDPLLRPFSDWATLFGMPRFTAFHRIRPLGGTRVLARFDDADSSPAILAAGSGEGAVVLFAFGAGTEWTDWPRSEAGRVTYLSLMQWLVEYGRPAAVPQLNLAGGSRAEWPLDASQLMVDARLLPPRGPDESAAPAGGQAVRAGSLEGRPGLWFVTPPLSRAGIYELALRGRDGGRSSVYFAVNVPPEERRLARASHAAVMTAVKSPRRLQVLSQTDRAVEAILRGPTAPAGYWIVAAALAVLVLLVESFLAYRFGNPAAPAPSAAPSGRDRP